MNVCVILIWRWVDEGPTLHEHGHKNGSSSARHSQKMELEEHGFLEELLSTRRDTWDSFFFTNDEVQQNLSCFTSFVPNFDCLSEVYCPLNPSEDADLHRLGIQHPKVELGQQTLDATGAAPVVFNAQSSLQNIKVRKVEGMPSKNLMAERRRRKRLNDRLSMLRSVVPKISKMDRTSILGDTIDYMKELLEKIKQLQEDMNREEEEAGNLVNVFKDLNPSEVLMRNSPKFDVERRDSDTRVEICCAAKPGLLLSTVSTLEALGMEIQQCVVSCFNDFGMQASCSEDVDQRAVLSAEDIKQTLFRNAGYGGRCF